jgi:lysophospholipase L1-like esterase
MTPANQDRRFPPAAILVALTFGAATLLVGEYARRSTWLVLLALLCFGITVGALIGGGRWLRSARATRLALLLCGLTVLLVLPEIALRMVDFRYEAGIQFGYPRPEEFSRFEPDPVLLWKHAPSNRGINSMGFRGPEVVRPNPEGTQRVLFLGDSCTEQGFPSIVELLLNELPGRDGAVFDTVSLAVSGYTSFQGLRAAELYGEQLEPDLVVVYFGWNDHWRAYGAVDSEKIVRPPADGAGDRLAKAVSRLRTVQALRFAQGRLRGSSEAHALSQVRVPAPAYRQNLTEIADLFGQLGVPVLFVTAPTAHYALGVPDFLVEQGFVENKEASVRLHREYNEIAREVAQQGGAYLLDLEAEMSPRTDHGKLFSQDGIHFTPPGLMVVALQIARFVDDRILPGAGGG